MTSLRIGALVGVAITLLFVPQSGLAQDAIQAPGQKHIGGKPQIIPSLAVLNSRGAGLTDGKLTMSGVTPNSIIFADRPYRTAGHVLTSEFIKQWGEGKDSFAKDPPNATLSVLNKAKSTVADIVVVLKAPKLDGDRLVFDVVPIEGDLGQADGPATLFIDIVNLPIARRTGHRAAWYAGAKQP